MTLSTQSRDLEHVPGKPSTLGGWTLDCVSVAAPSIDGVAACETSPRIALASFTISANWAPYLTKSGVCTYEKLKWLVTTAGTL